MNRSIVGMVRQTGMTLIELLVAMVIGLLVIGGVGAVFLSTSSSVKALDQVASLQESGRFAISTLVSDIGMANAQYCSGSGGVARPTGASILLDDLRAPKVYARGALLLNALKDVTTPWGSSGYPAVPTKAYAMPEYLSMRGYDCTTSSCTPVDPNASISAIPAQGTAIGKRVVGSSVLTLRYLDSTRGWSVTGQPGGSSITAGIGGAVQTITLSPQSGEPAVNTFGASSLAMLADCSLSQVFAVTGQGGSSLVPDAGNNFDTPNAMTGSKALRLFDFNNAYNTVTYFLQVVDAGNGNGETTGALMRRFNGTSEELVRGIERLNFRYGVMQASGLVRFMTANEIDTAGVSNCPWEPSMDSVTGVNPKGCLWRAVTSVEVDLLASGQVPLRNLTDQELFYSYGAQTTPAAPTSHAIQPVANQGFPQRLLRREFTALVATRNFNP
ncbi:MAG: PilW family protein [Xanthomonadales bacterium]|nr:PilW family protein [Xanthomonadales bacterium]